MAFIFDTICVFIYSLFRKISARTFWSKFYNTTVGSLFFTNYHKFEKWQGKNDDAPSTETHTNHNKSQ